jgi:1-acyl-sn-glycerol-3-phosphate acyltransferase
MLGALLSFVSAAAYYTAAFYAILIAVMWPLCYLRILPGVVYQVYFALTLIPNFLALRLTAGVCEVSRKYLGVHKFTTSNWTAKACVWHFWLQTALNPQIQIVAPDRQSREVLDALQPGSMICLPHYSFYDSFFFVGFVKPDIVENCRTLIKSSLQQMPILGGVQIAVGHFPVYFKDEAGRNAFSVDAEKQAKVTADMVEWVTAKKPRPGNMSIFPEGVLSDTPGTLSPFRFGSLKFALEHKMPFVLLATWGTHVTWPKRSAIGGLPANVSYTVRKFEQRAGESIEDMAQRMQRETQEMVDALAAAEEKRSGVGKPSKNN